MKNIINKYHYKIEQIIKNFTGNYNEDLEQEVYIKVFKNQSNYKEENKFNQWICTIAANLCRDYLKSSTFKKQNITDNDDEKITLIKDNKNPEVVYTLKERQKIVLKAVDKLPKKLKEAIVLYEFEDYSYEQISKKLHIPEGTVKSRINSARKKLQEELQFLLEEI